MKTAPTMAHIPEDAGSVDAATGTGAVEFPAYGYRDKASTVDKKIAQWVKQELDEQENQSQEALSSAVGADAKKIQQEIEAIADAKKRINSGDVVFSAMVPQSITLRQLLSMVLDSKLYGVEYIWRQCTRAQYQRFEKINNPNSSATTINSDFPFANTPLPAMDDLIRAVELMTKLEKAPGLKDELMAKVEKVLSTLNKLFS